MRRLHGLSFTQATGLGAAFALSAALFVTACSSESNSPISPSASGGMGLATASAVTVAPGNCPDTGSKDESAPFGPCDTGETIFIKAGNQCFTVTGGDTQVYSGGNSTGTLCYVIGADGFVTQVGPGPTCKSISHINCSEKKEPPPPTKEICDDKIDNDGDGFIDGDDPDCKV